MRDAFAPPVNSVTSRKSKSTSDLIISPSGKNPGIIGHTLRHMCPYNKQKPVQRRVTNASSLFLSRDHTQQKPGPHSVARYCQIDQRAVPGDHLLRPDRRDGSSATERKILGIRQEEIRHYHTFVNIYTSLTGQKPPGITPEPCPKNYREALEFALKDEQETVDFYLHIADRAVTPHIKQAYMRAAQDEQRHAVWFLFFWTKQCCLKSN